MARSLYIVPGKKKNIKKKFNKLQNSTRSGFNPAMIFASIIPIPRGKCRIMVVGCCGSLSSVLASDRPESQIHGWSLCAPLSGLSWFINIQVPPPITQQPASLRGRQASQVLLPRRFARTWDSPPSDAWWVSDNLGTRFALMWGRP